MSHHQVELDADLADLVPAFLANRKRELGTLRAALQARDTATIGKIAHNLKGVAGSYGFMDLANLGLQMQEAVERRDVEGLAGIIDAMAHYLSEVEVSYR